MKTAQIILNLQTLWGCVYSYYFSHLFRLFQDF